MQIGTEEAEKQLSRGDGLGMLVRKENIELIRKPSRSVGRGTALRSEIEFTSDHTRITIYEDSIDRIVRDCADFVPRELRLSRGKAFDMHLAHELFHHIEFSSGKTVSERLPKVEITQLGFIKRRLEVNECCEIAAQAFAKRFCGLKVLPTYYDLAYVRAHSKAHQ